MHYLIIAALFFTSALICFYIARARARARARNANARFWIAMGIAFGPLAIPFAFFSRSLSHQQ